MMTCLPVIHGGLDQSYRDLLSLVDPTDLNFFFITSTPPDLPAEFLRHPRTAVALAEEQGFSHRRNLQRSLYVYVVKNGEIDPFR